MEHYVEQVNIESDKINDDIKICAFSDLHLKEIKRDIVYTRSIIRKIGQLKPDYITGLGDYYYGFKEEKKEMQDSLVYLLHGLREIAPVIMSLGNHDLSINNESELRKDFRDLESYNIYPLDNVSVEFDNIYFSGYFEKKDTFGISMVSKRKLEMLIEDMKNADLLAIEDKFSILLCHNPFIITSPAIIDNFPNIYDYDLILSGHCHNGLMSVNTERKISGKIDNIIDKLGTYDNNGQITNVLESLKSFGIVVGPTPFTRYARGLHDVSDTKLFITRGVTSQSKDGDSFISEINLVHKLKQNKPSQKIY